MKKLVLVTVMVAVVPTQPVAGTKLEPGQPLGPQPPAVTGLGIAKAITSKSNAA